MSMSIEAILADARKLVLRLKEHDTSADCLVARTQSLQKQLDAMKQFQKYLNELNEVARHRPRIGLIITLAQENSKIRELQQENSELRQSLEEHQSALELIMSKYREHVDKLAKANSIERSLLQQSLDQSQDLQLKSEKITEMAAIMNRAVSINGQQRVDDDRPLIAQLEYENHLMRQLLQIDGDGDGFVDTRIGVAAAATDGEPRADIETQTDDDDDIHHDDDSADTSTHDNGPLCNDVDCSTLVRNPRRRTKPDSANILSEGSQNFQPTCDDQLTVGASAIEEPPSSSKIPEEGASSDVMSPESGSKIAEGISSPDALPESTDAQITVEESASAHFDDKVRYSTAVIKKRSGKKWLQQNCNCSNSKESDAAVAVAGFAEQLADSREVAADIEVSACSPPSSILADPTVDRAAAGDSESITGGQLSASVPLETADTEAAFPSPSIADTPPETAVCQSPDITQDL